MPVILESGERTESTEHTHRWSLGDCNYRLLSTLTGYGPHYLGRVLRGRSNPSQAVAQKIADAASVELGVLQAYLAEQQAQYHAREKPDGQRKLSDVDAALIRARYANRMQTHATVRSLAADFNVSRQTISLIIRGIIYKQQIVA